MNYDFVFLCNRSDQVHLSARVDDVAVWMLPNRLQLNTGKTDLLWCATARRCHQLPTSALRIGSDFVNPSTSVRDLGIYFDADLSMRCHVQKTAASCFAVLRQLRSIRRSVPTSVYQTLVVALVLSRLDYGNAVVVGLPGYLYSRLQSILNAAARSIADLRRSDHITDALASFHWLKAPERVQYKLATIVYRSLNATTPRHLFSDLRRLSDMPSRRCLRSSLAHQLDVRQSLCATVVGRTFAIAGARLWNRLPPDIIACDTVPRFRRELKTFLF